MSMSATQRQAALVQARRLLTSYKDRGEALRFKGLIDIVESDGKRIDDLQAALIRMNDQLVRAGILVEVAKAT